MSNALRETTGLITTLQETLAGFTAKERSLLRTRQHLESGADRPHESAVSEEEARFSAECAALEEEARAAQGRLAAWDTRRRNRLKNALATARKARLDRIEAAKGREILAVQQGRMQAAREKSAALQSNDARLAEVGGGLENARQALVALRRRLRSAFRGGLGLSGLLRATPAAEPDRTAEAFAEFNARFPETQARVDTFRRRPLLALFAAVPVWVFLLALAVVAAGAFVPALGWPLGPTLIAAAVAAGVVMALYGFSGHAARGDATALAGELARLEALYESCTAQAKDAHAVEAAGIETAAAATLQELDARWQAATREAETHRQAVVGNLSEKSGPLLARHEAFFARRQAALSATRDADLAALAAAHTARLEALTRDQAGRVDRQRADNSARWDELITAWQASVPPLQNALRQREADGVFPEWTDPAWDTWQPPRTFGPQVPFGVLEGDPATLAGGLPTDPRLAWTGPERFAVPVVLPFPEAGSLVVETSRSASDRVAGLFNALILRLLAIAPAGRLSLTLLDPVGLGQNFAGLMHLADFEESVITKRIWTQSAEIDQRLADLNTHIEKVIQLQLRNEYPTIREYNAQAGNIAEKYHVLVAADFPVNFSETALRHLTNIAATGPRCGVFVFLHHDLRHAAPKVVMEELRRSATVLNAGRDGLELAGFSAPGVRFLPATPPGPEFTTAFLHRVGLGWKDSQRVEVPFSLIAPAPGQEWTEDTSEELRVPIGRAGAAKLQDFALGRATRQHALIGGKTGSGKSTLFHVLITNLALRCRPDEVEFYLVDFKKGVEFKCYATHHLPHARVVAIESDREFGLAVLQRVDEELRRRGDLFRQLGVQNLAAFRKAGGGPLPRTLLLVDEFQEYFVEDDRIAQEANVLLDRIVRQGRAFGLHVVLGSQTLGGAYTLARATMGQMVVRIALQCNEADAHLIMDDTNPAPRFLTRPGEGIYNDMAGAVEGNSPFQTVWLDEDERDRHLEAIRRRAAADGLDDRPFVFEGNAPADLRDNRPLAALRAHPPAAAPAAPFIWLGEPNAIKGPTSVAFPRQSGRHLLIVGQAEDAILALFAAALAALTAQHPAGSARFLWLDATTPDTPARRNLERLIANHPVEIIRPPELAETLTALAARAADPAATDRVFVFAPHLPFFKKLRQEDDLSFSFDESAATSPAKLFAETLTEGPAHGVHVLAGCDTFNNVQRFIGRKPLTEFELRVLFQMNANDSASLIDSPKAGALGLHRALLHNGHDGTLEIFRPYGMSEGGLGS